MPSPKKKDNSADGLITEQAWEQWERQRRYERLLGWCVAILAMAMVGWLLMVMFGIVR